MGLEKIHRGDIFIGNLDPAIGSEQGGTRPGLIIQNNLANKYGPTTIIAAITSRKFKKPYPTNISLSKNEAGLNKDSTILLNQIRIMDKSRLTKKIGFLDSETMKQVDKAIKISLDLN